MSINTKYRDGINPNVRLDDPILLQREFKFRQEQLNVKECSITSLRNQLAEVQVKLDSEIKLRVDERERANNIIQDLISQLQIEKQQPEKSQYERRVLILRKISEQLNDANKECANEIDSLTAQLINAQENNNQMEDEIDQLKAQVDSLTASNTKMSEKINEYEAFARLVLRPAINQ